MRFFRARHKYVPVNLVTFVNLLVLRQGIRGHAVPLFRTRCEYIHVRWRDIPVAQGSEVRYRTPSAMCKGIGQWFLIGELP